MPSPRRSPGSDGLHFLFNSAGAAINRCKFLEIDDGLLNKTLAINLHGTFYGMQAVIPHMLDNGGGVIVNVCSMTARRGGPGASIHYAAAKGAIDSMTLGVARSSPIAASGACRSRRARSTRTSRPRRTRRRTSWRGRWRMCR